MEKGFATEVIAAKKVAAVWDCSKYENAPAARIAALKGDTDPIGEREMTDTNVEAQWQQAIEDLMAGGRRSRPDAIKVLIKTRPKLHRDFMAAFNERRGHKMAAERIRRHGV